MGYDGIHESPLNAATASQAANSKTTPNNYLKPWNHPSIAQIQDTGTSSLHAAFVLSKFKPKCEQTLER
jgi:hypothetical protein